MFLEATNIIPVKHSRKKKCSSSIISVISSGNSSQLQSVMQQNLHRNEVSLEWSSAGIVGAAHYWLQDADELINGEAEFPSLWLLSELNWNLWGCQGLCPFPLSPQQGLKIWVRRKELLVFLVWVLVQYSQSKFIIFATFIQALHFSCLYLQKERNNFPLPRFVSLSQVREEALHFTWVWAVLLSHPCGPVWCLCPLFLQHLDSLLTFHQKYLFPFLLFPV